jgi:hypothetical protein
MTVRERALLSKTIYKYDIREFSKAVSTLVDPVTGQPNSVAFVMETMNDLGSQGIRCLAPPIPSQRQSAVNDAVGNPITNYVLLIFTEEVVQIEEPTADQLLFPENYLDATVQA